MRNRAKCGLCKAEIESMTEHDYVKCSCDEIAISGGEKHWYAYARNFNNFFRLDEQDKEIPVKYQDSVKESAPQASSQEQTVMSKEELIDQLRIMVECIKEMDESVMQKPVTHYDYSWLLRLLSSIFTA